MTDDDPLGVETPKHEVSTPEETLVRSDYGAGEVGACTARDRIHWLYVVD